MDIALNGFEFVGLWPYNRNVFKDEEYSVIIPETENYTEPTEKLSVEIETTLIDTRTLKKIWLQQAYRIAHTKYR